MSLLQIFLPVIWTVVAVLVGLVLYKTSESVVQVRVARVTGSAAIAAIAFYGLYRATPRELLAPSTTGNLSIPVASMKLTQRYVEEALSNVRDDLAPHCQAGAVHKVQDALLQAQSDIRGYLASANP